MKYIQIIILGIAILSISCKRESVDVIGPELAIATPNFKLDNDLFSAESAAIDFTTDSNWFNASFNERVSWELVITGQQSTGVKRFKGISSGLSRTNTNWTGSQSDLYFFRTGETAIAELTVFGSNKKWYDTITIVKEKNKWAGSDIIVWWDMNTTGIAQNGWPYVYWFDYYDTNERLADFMVPSSSNDPLQGLYRTMEGKDGLGGSDYYIGAAGHSALTTPAGFSNSLDKVYLNFYLRRKTTTSNMGVSLTSIASGDTSTITYSTGHLDWEGWKLISVPLSQMTLDAGNPPFNPSKIATLKLVPYIYLNPGVDQSGFDIDFITITNGRPFNPDRY